MHTDSYQEWQINVRDAQQREILIAQLSELGFDGFEESADFLKAYGKPETILATDVQQLLSAENLQATTTEIAPQNWNALWESSFEPVEIGNFCRIRAGFHSPVEGFQHQICITPKMSFGTGHHATTRMMIMMMERLAWEGKTVLDFGTGTGVLAILAEKLGAQTVLAIENDRGAVENTRENVEANNCRRVQVAEGSLEQAGNQTFDGLLANINRNILLHYADGLVARLNTGGNLLLSGILREDESLLREAFEMRNLTFSSALHEGNWTCLRFTKDKDS